MPQDSKWWSAEKQKYKNSRLTVLITKISSFTWLVLTWFWFEEYKVNLLKQGLSLRHSIHFTFNPYQPYDKQLFNRPFLSSQNPHFQKEAKCSTFLVKMSFICMRSHFHIKGWALNLILIQGLGNGQLSTLLHSVTANTGSSNEFPL